jgi:hypothetical protein
MHDIDTAPSFGFGDRIGLATPGHVAAMQRAGDGFVPIYAQQSIREMSRTGRTPSQVLADVARALAELGVPAPLLADADHLKTTADVDATAAAGFTLFTIDPSAHVGNGAADDPPWASTQAGRSERLSSGTVLEFTADACRRAAVKYGRAVRHACELGAHIARTAAAHGREFRVELSVDETDEPTSLVEHFLVAEQCRRQGVRLWSIAPRFIGDFEKGVDYRGDLAALARSLADHAAVARRCGGYKLSLHSGSDKLSMYPLLARATGGRLHVKTAGTSYLEAVRVAARCDGNLFRRIVGFARERYETDRATYHVHATLASAPPPEDVRDDAELERHYLERWSDVAEGAGFEAPGRQILHCTFGSVLTHPELGPSLRALLAAERATHTGVLAEHFARHLRALRAGLAG